MASFIKNPAILAHTFRIKLQSIELRPELVHQLYKFLFIYLYIYTCDRLDLMQVIWIPFANHRYSKYKYLVHSLMCNCVLCCWHQWAVD